MSCYSTLTFPGLISTLGFVAGVTRLLCCLAALLLTEAYSLFMVARSLLCLHGYLLFSVIRVNMKSHTGSRNNVRMTFELFPNKNTIIVLNVNSTGEPTDHRSDLEWPII